MARALSSYEQKRDFSRTREPRGDEHPAPRRGLPRFVVQEHHASALHWDFRLEHDGVGVSWAVPKGLPMEPATNHLAVHTEDHPLDYFAFEGEIPEGEYGGGRVMVWDAGTFDLEEWTDRKVKVVLHGERVQGRYALFQTRGKSWMVHRMDPPSVDGWEPLPELVAPMLAVTGELPTDATRWAYELKWDGVRAVVYVDGGRPRVLTRNDRDVTGTYPELRAMAEGMGSTQAVLDGELVAFDAAGRPSFERLQQRMHVVRPATVRRLVSEVPVSYLVFDLLHLDGRSLLSEPYAERRRLLESLALAGACWATPPSFRGEGGDVMTASTDQGLEGVVAKRVDSRYLPGRRSDSWVKVKTIRTQETVVVGWKPGQGRRAGRIGSLLLAVNTADGLVYAGHVGTGFSEAALDDLTARLTALERRSSPLDGAVPREYARDARWVEPQLVAEVAFGEWTTEGRLRHPRYRGLRPDKSPAEVVREP